MDEKKVEAFMSETLESLKGLRGEVGGLRGEVGGLRGDVRDLQQGLGALRGEFQEFRGEVNAHLTGISQFLLASEKNVTQLTARMDSLEVRVERLEDRDKSA